MAPFVEHSDIGSAYSNALGHALDSRDHDYLTIHIDDPVAYMEHLPRTLEMDEWEGHVNAGGALRRFQRYSFYDGTTGREWVQNRIEELFTGIYAERLRHPRNQLAMIADRLNQGNHGQTTNALVAQVFQIDPDLELATHGRPLAPDIACLTQLQVRPDHDTLNMYAVFRSQFFDTKLYGNLISLAVLLAELCDRTGYEPGFLMETVNNITFRSNDDAKGLNETLNGVMVNG